VYGFAPRHDSTKAGRLPVFRLGRRVRFGRKRVQPIFVFPHSKPTWLASRHSQNAPPLVNDIYRLRSRLVGGVKTRSGVNKVDIKGKVTLELSEELLYLRWNRGAYIGIDVARAALEAISTLCQGARLPMLVEI
jgi:hypothetical protein